MAHNTVRKMSPWRAWRLALVLMIAVGALAMTACGGSGAGAGNEPAGDGGSTEAAATAWIPTKVTIVTEGDASRTLVNEYELDEHGNAVKQTVTIDGEVQSTSTSEFDENGFVTKLAVESEGDSHEDVYENEFDDEGRLVRRASQNVTTEYGYGDDGTLTSISMTSDYTGDGTHVATTDFYMDADGNLVEYNLASSETGMHSVFTYEFDDEGRPASAVIDNQVLDGKGELSSEYESTITYEYDENGNLVRTVTESPVATVEKTYEYAQVTEPTAGALLDAKLAIMR